MPAPSPRPDLYNLPFTFDSFRGMPYRQLGRSGLHVSSVGLGLWKIGYPETGDGARLDEHESWQVLDRAAELGVTFWDTANRYNASSGNSERIIGKWLAANPEERRNIVLATKLYGGMDGRTPNHCRLSRSNILDSVHASLERLQTDRIDLLYFHSFDAITPIEESLEAIEDLVQRDLVRYFAVSNFSAQQLADYAKCAESMSSRCRVVAVQNQFDILNGELKNPGVLEYCATQGPSFVAYSPLARGLLSNKYLEPGALKSGARLVDEGTVAKDLTDEKAEQLRGLAAIASEAQLSISQLALSYMLTLDGMGPIIASASTLAQLDENAAVATAELTDAMRTQIQELLA